MGTTEQLDSWKTLEGQTALNSAFSGESSEPLKALMAAAEGVEPTEMHWRTGKWEASDASGDFTFLGAVDPLVDLSSMMADLPTYDSFTTENHVQAKESFHYQPLQSRQIRLLSNGDPDVHGVIESSKLTTHDLDEAPPFFALSYVWGDSSRHVSLTANNQNLMITDSLALAIQRSMPWARGVPLWADGICINQEDLSERGEQVKMMGQIYSRAAKVLAHLGRPAERGRESNDWSAISLMTMLNNIWSSDKEFALKRRESGWKELGVPNDDPEIWNMLISFWLNPWFTRCWIFQEAVLGDEVVLFFGNATCSIKAVTTFWAYTQRYDLPHVLRYGALADLYAISRNLGQVPAIKKTRVLHRKATVVGQTTNAPALEGEPGETSLLDLLILCRPNLVKDPRDKIYGVLGLASDGTAKSIMPCYQPSNTWQNLYTDVARKYLNQGSVYLLHHAGVSSSSQLPSWAPDWSSQTRSTFNPAIYDCTGFLLPSVTLWPDQNMLNVRGTIIDLIWTDSVPTRFFTMENYEQKFAPHPRAPHMVAPECTDQQMRQIVHRMATLIANDECKETYTVEGIEIAVARTLTADVAWTGKRTSTDPNFNASYHAFARLCERTESAPHLQLRRHELEHDEQQVIEQLIDDAWAFESVMNTNQKGRKFCSTKEGRMGLVPWDAVSGDQIVLFQGISMPFVMRRIEGLENHWRIIGDAYIHGVMDGELIRPCEDEEEGDQVSLGSDRKTWRTVSKVKDFAKLEDFVIV